MKEVHLFLNLKSCQRVSVSVNGAFEFLSLFMLGTSGLSFISDRLFLLQINHLLMMVPNYIHSYLEDIILRARIYIQDQIWIVIT